jgi:hypothetical protein
MNWEKKGRILSIEDFNEIKWMQSHLQVPVIMDLENGNYRLYFNSRYEGKSLPTFVEIDKETLEIVCKNSNPLLELGKPGMFDDSGVMVSSVIKYDNKIYMYYIGWNEQVSVSYQNAIGLAISHDGGLTFRKISDGPVIGRSFYDPIFVASPYVIKVDDIWIMYYLSCTEWIKGEDKMEPLYNIRYAKSKDGVYWDITANNVCIYNEKDEAIANPCVIKDDDCFRMWYSTRKSLDYRTNKENTYKIGYAESRDGYHWTRKDSEVGIDISETGWDSQMLAYANVIKERDRYLMVYNGNGFGQSGIGLAECVISGIYCRI